jgi:hypothetical protein
MLGQLAGGALCDYATSRLGLRWGRIIPLIGAQLFCASAYLLCPFIDSTWGIVGLCAVVSVCTDLGTPAIWANLLKDSKVAGSKMPESELEELLVVSLLNLEDSFGAGTMK